MVNSITELANNDAFRREFSNTLRETASAVSNNLNVDLGQPTISLMSTGSGQTSYNDAFNGYVGQLNTQITTFKNDQQYMYNLEHDNPDGIDKIFDYIKPSVDVNNFFKQKIYADESDNQNNYTCYMYYDNIKKLKNYRDDISYNIDTARKLFHRLDYYTNTNPNLHLLSKTKDKLQNKIDSYEKHMNVDSKLNKELEINIKNNKNYNYYLLIIYYVILILFFIFSNFMKNKYYKNPVATVMIILYIIAPFIIKYILLYIYKFYLYIMKKFNLLNTGLTYEDIIKYDSYNYENNQENISYV